VGFHWTGIESDRGNLLDSLVVRLALDSSKDLEMGTQFGMRMGTVHERWKTA